MAVLKSVIDVNNGNTGWTRQNVMDAFETAMANLGLHSGTTRTGVPQQVVGPTGDYDIPSSRINYLEQANNGDGGDLASYWTYPITNYYRVTDVVQAATLNFSTTSETGNYLVTGSDRVTTFSGAQDPGITMYVGDTITFDNTATYSGHPMYIRVSDGGSSVSSPAASGEGTATVSWTPTVAGTYYYQCSIHAAMLGTITVSQTPSGGGASSGYRVEKYIVQRMDYSVGADLASDEVRATRHGFNTGDAIRYAKDQTNTAYNLGSNVIINTIYYVIKTSRDKFKLATTLANANNGVAIDIDNYTSSSDTIEYFTQEDQGTDYVNPSIELYYGDLIQFDNQSGNSSNFTMCRDVSSFDANQRIVYGDSNHVIANSNWNDFRYNNYTNIPGRQNTDTNISCAPGTSVTWDTQNWEVTETEPFYPAELTNPSYVGLPGADGVRNYIYCSETNASAKGEIILIHGAVRTNHSWWASYPYWKYTVPASGGRSELKLRIWRHGWNNGQLRHITIHNIATGWTDDEVFTIPGELVGGTAGTGDIRFGTQTQETSNGANDGTASIRVTTLGSGSNFYQKHDTGAFAVMNVENDSVKKYGHTFYSFFIEGSNSTTWYLRMQSGTGWEPLNHRGTDYAGTNFGYYGRHTGYNGLDKQNGGGLITNAPGVAISTNATPTAYPMQIRVYRAQTPQDTNFAVIQFVQIINGNVIPFGQFSLHTGDAYGNGIFDLDHVYLGGLTIYDTSTQAIDVTTMMAGYDYSTYYYGYTYYRGTAEVLSEHAQGRNAYYGYMRGSDNSVNDQYKNNINDNSGKPIAIYYRNSTYDKFRGMSVDSAADYYKPIKTIPIGLSMIPCPYYLPDDYVLIQVATTPGLTDFRPGDTITVSASEIYEVILASYQTEQTGLDGVADNTSEGILFCARTT